MNTDLPGRDGLRGYGWTARQLLHDLAAAAPDPPDDLTVRTVGRATRRRRASAVLLSLVTVAGVVAGVTVLVALAGGRPGIGVASGPTPAVGKSACSRPPVDVGSIDECAAVVDRLNSAFLPSLRAALPPAARITSNVFSPRGPIGVTFLPVATDEHRPAYEAFLRIDDNSIIATLDVQVSTYATVTEFDCTSKDRAEREAKGIVELECDRRVAADGTVAIVNVDAYPYGAGKFAKVLVPSVFVGVFRPDHTVVRFNLDSKSEPVYMQPSGVMRLPITVAQLIDLAARVPSI